MIGRSSMSEQDSRAQHSGGDLIRAQIDVPPTPSDSNRPLPIPKTPPAPPTPTDEPPPEPVEDPPAESEPKSPYTVEQTRWRSPPTGRLFTESAIDVYRFCRRPRLSGLLNYYTRAAWRGSRSRQSSRLSSGHHAPTARRRIRSSRGTCSTHRPSSAPAPGLATRDSRSCGRQVDK